MWRKTCEILSRRLSVVGLAALLVRDGETTTTIDFVFLSGGCWGQRRKSSPNAVFLGKRHDNKVLNSKILLSIIDLLMDLLRGVVFHRGGCPKSEEDKRATTNVQNGLVIFFLLFSSL